MDATARPGPRRTRPRRARATCTLLAVAIVALLGGCGTDGSGDGDEHGHATVTVLAASSVAVAVEETAVALGFDVAVVSAGSQVLAAQVAAGAPGDLVLLADPEAAAELHEAGLLDAPTPLLATGLAVVAPPDLADDLDVGDLADPARRVVLADAGVPLGDLTRQALAVLATQRGEAGFADAVLDGADSLEDAATSVLAKVASGEADLAIVYFANALHAAEAGDVRMVANLDDTGVESVVTAQTATQEGVQLLTQLATAAGRQRLRAHGFVVLGG